MTIKIFEKFNDIPGIEDYSGKISVFATQEYADYLKEIQNCSVIWFCGLVNQNIQFILPFAVRVKYFFKRGEFLTATIHFDENSYIENERDFLDSIATLIKKKKLCDWIQQPPNWAIFNLVPDSSIYCEFGTYKINLLESAETELFSKLKNNTRYEIRKAIKNNIVIKKGFEFLEDALKIFQEVSNYGGLKYPDREAIQIILKHLYPNIQLYVSYHNDIPQSCNLFFYNKYSHYGLYSAAVEKPAFGANYLLFWKMICDLKTMGVKYFDFVGARIYPEPGSKQEKIQLFKKHFGGALIKGYLWKMPVSKFKYNVYNYLIKIVFVIKQKTYLGDIIDQEKNKEIIS
jgi:hypothetical protein